MCRIKLIKKTYSYFTHGTTWNLEIASGYEIKAKPVPPPDDTTSAGSTFISYARFPRIPNIVMPDNNDVKVSKVVIMSASLKIFKGTGHQENFIDRIKVMELRTC